MEGTTAAWLEDQGGKVIPAASGCSMGRAPTNTVVIADTKVSRNHAVIHPQGTHDYMLVDLGSRNGTLVNGRRVTQPTRLRDGDRIKLGEVVLLFRSPMATGREGSTVGSEAKTLPDIVSSHRWLVVGDIEGSTEVVQRASPEEISMQWGRWFSLVKRIIESRGGSICQYLGDGFFATWENGSGVPRQVATALEEFKQAQAQPQPAFRVVTHIGTVHTGSTPSTGESLLGPPVNFVFRMEKLAGKLGLNRLLSDEAVEALQGMLPTSAVEGDHDLSGFEGQYRFHTY
jgi:adenylate cyclase